MNQALHIFGKDTRHLRWEILVSLALTGAYLWVAPYEWKQAFGLGANVMFASEMSLIVGALAVLVPVSWWLVVTRAVQDENLVGDQQWWVTKPYDWGNLLGAKLLFLAAFIFAPVFVMQCVLLRWAGFDPMAVLPALGVRLAILGLVIVLPLLAIGTVTSSIARSTLTVLGVLLAIVAALAMLVNYAMTNGDFEISGMGWIFEVVIVAGIGAAIVLEYARRLVWKARLIMVGTVALLIVIALFPTTSSMMGRVYRPTSGSLQFALDQAGKSYAQQVMSSRVVAISVPVTVSGIAPGDGAVIEGAQATLDGSDGQQWITPWQAQYAGVYLPGDDLIRTGNLTVRTKRWFHEREAGKPVTLHLRLAVAELRADKPVQIALPNHEFAVPGFGICMPVERSVPGEFGNLSCRAAVRGPMKTLIKVRWSDAPCSDQEGSSANVQGEGWAGSLEPGSGLGLNPVEQVGFDLSNAYKMINGVQTPRPRFLCPGTPITFTPYRVVRRAEYDATFANFVMPKDGAEAPGPYGVGVRVGQ